MKKCCAGGEDAQGGGQPGRVCPGNQPVKSARTMKITIINPNAKVALGFPAVATFEITAKNLAAFNRSQGDTIRNAPSFNEEWNESAGLPGPEARQWLRSLYSDKFGVMGGNLTMADVKGAVK